MKCNVYPKKNLQSKDPRFHALPIASQRSSAFADAVNELVYDVLMLKVRQGFNGLSHLDVWSSVEEQSAYRLPSFSAYPQTRVTSVGDYLLTLPQELEPLAEGIANSDINAEEAQFFATEWMFKVTYRSFGFSVFVLDGCFLLYTRHLSSKNPIVIDLLSTVMQQS